MKSDNGKIKSVTQDSAVRFEFGIWFASCLVAVLGVLTAAQSEQPLFWLLVWPVPLALACTVFIFIRQGLHFQNGLLVLGRRS